MKAKNLKLIARTDEDLRVISAHLQDSIGSNLHIASLPKNKIFLMQLNRFMWEDVEKGDFRKNKRIRTVLKFENVLEVSVKKNSQSNKDKFLDFLVKTYYHYNFFSETTHIAFLTATIFYILNSNFFNKSTTYSVPKSSPLFFEDCFR